MRPFPGHVPVLLMTLSVCRPEAPPIVRLRATADEQVLRPTSTPYCPGSVIDASQPAVGTPLLQFSALAHRPPPGLVHAVVPEVQSAADAALAGRASASRTPRMAIRTGCMVSRRSSGPGRRCATAAGS